MIAEKQARLRLLVFLAILAAGGATGCQGDIFGIGYGGTSVDKAEMIQGMCDARSGFAFVRGGDFIAGSDRTERDYAYRISAEGRADSAVTVAEADAHYRKQGWFDHEPERRTVNLPSFCMSENLITNVEYQIFVKATGRAAPAISEQAYQAQGYLVHDYSEVKPYLWRDTQYPAGKGQYPVVLVSYEDVLAYVDWRSHRDGVSYRLPSALEWEKAVRGTDGRYFPWGNQWRNDATNWAKNGPYGTSAIGSYPASRSLYGIEDMAGNVFEYTSTLADKPKPEVILKGCGWDDYPGFCRAAYEHDRPVNVKHILFGFRLIME